MREVQGQKRKRKQAAKREAMRKAKARTISPLIVAKEHSLFTQVEST